LYGIGSFAGELTADHARSPALGLEDRFIQQCHLNGSRAWLGLLQFFFNHRRFTRSRCGKRLGKSPREAMAGEDHPHWLTLLGLGPLQPRQS
jgi:hypothetical protein